MARHAGVLKGVLRGVVLLILLSLLWWWVNLPRTPRQFFEVRCSTCHRLPDLCRYSPDQRAGIVVTMRTRQGADNVIDDEEAEIITTFLKERLECP